MCQTSISKQTLAGHVEQGIPFHFLLKASAYEWPQSVSLSTQGQRDRERKVLSADPMLSRQNGRARLQEVLRASSKTRLHAVSTN